MEKINFKKEDLLQGTGVRIEGKNIILGTGYLTKFDFNAPSGEMLKQGWSNLTKEDFVEIGLKLFDDAIKSYNKLKKVMIRYRIYDEVFNMTEESEKTTKVITELAEKKYKKDFYKNKYINDTMNSINIGKLMKIDINDNESLNRWFFDSHFGLDNAVSEYRIEDGVLNEQTKARLVSDLETIYDRINGHEIMQYAKSIKFSYQSYDKYMISMSWPTLSFNFSPEGDDIISKNKETLYRAMENFYKGTTYFGD